LAIENLRNKVLKSLIETITKTLTVHCFIITEMHPNTFTETNN